MLISVPNKESGGICVLWELGQAANMVTAAVSMMQARWDRVMQVQVHMDASSSALQQIFCLVNSLGCPTFLLVEHRGKVGQERMPPVGLWRTTLDACKTTNASVCVQGLRYAAQLCRKEIPVQGGATLVSNEVRRL